MAFWRTRQGSGIVFIVLMALVSVALDVSTQFASALAPLLTLRWCCRAFQRVPTRAWNASAMPAVSGPFSN